MKKKLAVIYANSDQIPLVEKAKEMGIETHCFAWDKEERHCVCKGVADYFHPISVLEKEQILDACKKIKIDGVTSIMKDLAVPTVAYVAQNMGLTGNGYENVLIARDKYSTRQAFIKNKVNSPRFAISEEGEIPNLTGFKYPLIVKPADSRDSIGVMKVDSEKDLQHAIFFAQQNTSLRHVVIEEFIDGSEHSVDSISWKGKHYVLAIKDKELSENYKALGKHYPSRLSLKIQETMKAETVKALDSINYRNGASNTQFKVAESGEIYSIEINPRMAGDYSFETVQLHNGYDYLKGVIDIALGRFEEPVFTYYKYSGLHYLHQETEWVRQLIEKRDCEKEIIRAEFYKKDEIIGGKEGYFLYQSDKKRNWKP